LHERSEKTSKEKREGSSIKAGVPRRRYRKGRQNQKAKMKTPRQEHKETEEIAFRGKDGNGKSRRAGTLQSEEKRGGVNRKREKMLPIGGD